MRVHDCNWLQLEDYLERDDRIVLPLGSTEQHAYLSLGTDAILAERVAVEAAEPLGVPVLPVVPYGITPTFAAARACGRRPCSRSSATCSTRSTGRASGASSS
jgi:creatinine amidohydrolase/Fe(II)-dependent formamide hydrolase-like protein